MPAGARAWPGRAPSSGPGRRFRSRLRPRAARQEVGVVDGRFVVDDGGLSGASGSAGSGGSGIVASAGASSAASMIAPLSASAGRSPAPAGSRWATASNSSTEPATAAFNEPTTPRIGIRTTRSQRRRTAGERPWPSLPTTIASGPRKSAWRAVSGAPASAPTIRTPRLWRSLRAPARSSTGASSRCSTAPAEALTADGVSGAWWRVGKTTPWTPAASALRSSVPTFWGSSSESRTSTNAGSAALDAPGEDLLDARPAARAGDEGDSLVTVEAGERRQRPAFDLDDRDPQARRVEDEAFEGLAPLGDDEQPDRGPLRDERLLDGAAAGDQLLVGAEQVGIGRGRRPEPGLAIRTGAGSVGTARTAGSGSGSRRWRAAPGLGGLGATVVDVRTGPGSRWWRAAPGLGGLGATVVETRTVPARRSAGRAIARRPAVRGPTHRGSRRIGPRAVGIARWAGPVETALWAGAVGGPRRARRTGRPRRTVRRPRRRGGRRPLAGRCVANVPAVPLPGRGAGGRPRAPRVVEGAPGMAGTGLGAAGAVRPGASMALWPRTAIRGRRLAPGPRAAGRPVGVRRPRTGRRRIGCPKPRRGAGSTSGVRAGLSAAVGRFGAFAFATDFGADAFAADDFRRGRFRRSCLRRGRLRGRRLRRGRFRCLALRLRAGTSPASRGLRARRCGCGSPSP